MKLSKKRVGLIVAVIVAALVGLLVVQSVLIRTAWDAKEQAFQRSVFAALDLAVKKLEAGEAVSESIRTMSFPHTPVWSGVKIVAKSISDSVIAPTAYTMTSDACEPISALPVRIEGDSFIYIVERPQHVTISMFDPDSGVSHTIVDTFREAGQYGFKMQREGSHPTGYMFRCDIDSSSFMLRTGGAPHNKTSVSLVDPDPQKRALVQRVLTQMLTVEMKTVEQRIDSVQLDSVVTSSLQEQGINLEHAYGVVSDPLDSITLAFPAVYRPQLVSSPFRTRLFPQDLLSRPASIVLYFPGHQAFLWKQMGPMLASVALFMLVIVFCFVYAIRVIARQRQFADRMTDFINNMTHEFKTPIATVTLASEAIAREDVIKNPDKLTRFNRMIHDETARMKTQVDKILQMAVLEEGDYDLNLTEVDIHTTITTAVENAVLHISARGGSIRSELFAERPIVFADRIHIANVIHNLLDNANKYSPGSPAITISTRNVNKGVEISVKDEGIGIAESDHKAVFDKYYRVSNGNVHNVKGFGLGLSYVKLMVHAHGGSITMDSALGKGTTIRAFLPFDGPEETRN